MRILEDVCHLPLTGEEREAILLQMHKEALFLKGTPSHTSFGWPTRPGRPDASRSETAVPRSTTQEGIPVLGRKDRTPRQVYSIKPLSK